MPNRTIDFRHLVEAKAAATATVARQQQQAHRDKNKVESCYDLFTKEAYRIYKHIHSLKRFLLAVRPAYLNTSTKKQLLGLSPTTTTQADAASTCSVMEKMDDDDDGIDVLFQLFSSGHMHRLTDRERDEIDFQAKLIIRRCMDRIHELEEAEKMRQAQEASKPTGRFNLFFSALGSGSGSGGSNSSTHGGMTEDVLFVHRSSMTWFLNQQLMQVSQIQKDQQEIRLNRDIEKSENQLSKSVYFEAPPVEQPPPQPAAASAASAASADNPFEQALSQEQVQMLEKENSMMLQDLNNTLNQVKSAEKALLEISTLQTQLANHVAAQTIQTDKLYADAIATTDKVAQGNRQLLTARERNKGSRNFMLIFLFGACFVLLFLDWYS